MRIFTVEEARQHIEQYRALARSAERRAREAEQRAAETDDPDMKRFWEADAKSELHVAAVIDEECDGLLRQLPEPAPKRTGAQATLRGHAPTTHPRTPQHSALTGFLVSCCVASGEAIDASDQTPIRQYRPGRLGESEDVPDKG